MDSVTFAWTLAATASAGVQSFLQRAVAHEGRDAAFSGLMMYGVSGIVAFGILALHPWPQHWIPAALFALTAGLLHSFANYTRIESFKYIESVIYFPINKVLGPILVVLAGVVIFGDALSPQQYIGIVFSLSVPLLLLSATEHHRQKDLRKGSFLLIVSTVLSACSIPFIKLGLLTVPDALFMIAIAQISGTACSAAILFKQRGIRSMVTHIDKRDIGFGFIIGGLGFLSSFTLFQALITGYVSLVYVIHAHYILIPIVLSIWWYKEHMNMRKAAAIIISSLAIILLYE